MADDSGNRYASMLAALSQPTRLRIVEAVAAGGNEGVPAGQIARAGRCPASTLSFHLKELSQAGLLHAVPDGRFIRYGIRPDAFLMLARFISSLPGSRGAPAVRKGRSVGRAKGKPARGPGAEREGQLSIFAD